MTGVDEMLVAPLHQGGGRAGAPRRRMQVEAVHLAALERHRGRLGGAALVAHGRDSFRAAMAETDDPPVEYRYEDL